MKYLKVKHYGKCWLGGEIYWIGYIIRHERLLKLLIIYGSIE